MRRGSGPQRCAACPERRAPVRGVAAPCLCVACMVHGVAAPCLCVACMVRGVVAPWLCVACLVRCVAAPWLCVACTVHCVAAPCRSVSGAYLRVVDRWDGVSSAEHVAAAIVPGPAGAFRDAGAMGRDAMAGVRSVPGGRTVPPVPLCHLPVPPQYRGALYLIRTFRSPWPSSSGREGMNTSFSRSGGPSSLPSHLARPSGRESLHETLIPGGVP